MINFFNCIFLKFLETRNFCVAGESVDIDQHTVPNALVRLSCHRCRFKESQIKDWEPHVAQQLQSTEGNDELKGHRELVSQRWENALGFLSSDHPSIHLSPNSKDLKSELYKSDGPLNESFLKGFKKRMAGYIQSLNNASERLNDVQRDAVGDDADDPSDSIPLIFDNLSSLFFLQLVLGQLGP